MYGRAQKPDRIERQTRKKEGYNGGNKRIDLRIKRVGMNETKDCETEQIRNCLLLWEMINRKTSIMMARQGAC